MSNITYDTHLHAAIIQQDFDWAEMAIKFGADINSIDENGNTPLHLVVMYGREKVNDFTTLLLDAGASLDIKNKDNLTAVEMAQDSDKWELAVEMASFHIGRAK